MSMLDRRPNFRAFCTDDGWESDGNGMYYKVEPEQQEEPENENAEQQDTL